MNVDDEPQDPEAFARAFRALLAAFDQAEAADKNKSPPASRATRSEPIGLYQFHAMALRGRPHMQKAAAIELADLRSGKSRVAELRVDAASPDGQALLRQLRDEGFCVTHAIHLGRRDSFDSAQALDQAWVAARDTETLQAYAQADCPIELGRLYGYSEDDIAYFYLSRRGGNVDTAYQEYLRDSAP